MLIVELLRQLVGGIWRPFCRTLNVQRSAPEDNHTTTEYVDALLFADEDAHSSDSSSPPSILSKRP